MEYVVALTVVQKGDGLPITEYIPINELGLVSATLIEKGGPVNSKHGFSPTNNRFECFALDYVKHV